MDLISLRYANIRYPTFRADGGLVKIELGGVCGSDVKYLHGGKAQLPYPLILEDEILGRVEKLGTQAAAIHGIREGDRIILKGAKAAAARTAAAAAPVFVNRASATADKRLAPTRPICSAAYATVSGV